jgi:hypothetical protein
MRFMVSFSAVNTNGRRIQMVGAKAGNSILQLLKTTQNLGHRALGPKNGHVFVIGPFGIAGPPAWHTQHRQWLEGFG